MSNTLESCFPKFELEPVHMIGVVKTIPDAIVPTKNYPSDAGFDLYSTEGVELKPGQISKIGTGISLSIPEGHFGLICDRSGHGSKGIKVFGGVVDSSYRGEVFVCLGLMNTFERSWIKLPKGSKIAQIVILPVRQVVLYEADKLNSTDRGEKGFGSSG